MNPQPAPATQPTNLVTVTILIDGTNVSQQMGGLLSLAVYREFNKIPTARLIFQDGAVETQTFAKSDAPNFVPGKPIDIQVGYQTNDTSIFRGVIVRHSVKIIRDKPSVLEIECRDEAVKMTLLRHSRYYYQQTDADTIRQLIGNYTGLSVGDLATTQPQYPEQVQHHATDWDFMVMRADANGLVVNVEDGKISVNKPAAAAQTNQKATNGANIIEFEASLDARTHWPAVAVNTWDYSQQQLSREEVDATAGGNNYFADHFFGTTPVPFFHGGDMATEELRAWASGRQTRSNLSRMRGRVRMRGTDLRPGQTLELQHVGDRFNGNYLISGVMHQVYGGTWLIDVQLGLSVQEFADQPAAVETPAAAGLFPGVRGLHAGIVSKIGGDSRSGGHRVQVRIPYLAQTDSGTQADGIWARLGTLYAGPDRGFAFRPEIGDEVILGFINDDPNDAIVLGALHSDNRAAPAVFDATDQNPRKGFVAKGGMRFIIDDDAKSLRLETADGTGYSLLLSEQDGKLVLTDKDNNTLTMSSSGISLDSKTDISIKATGNVTISGAKIDLN